MLESFITTKVRPIRKVFVIEGDDFESFFKIYKLLMNEIDGINNLILPANDSIYNSICVELVNRFDPDVLINYSKEESSYLAEYFNVKTYNSSDEHFNIHKFGSTLQSFTGKPFLVSKYPELITPKVFATSKIDKNPNSLFNALNYGSIGKREYASLKRSYSIFKDITIECADKITSHKDTIFENDLKFHNLTNGIGSAYENSSSVWIINYNESNHFRDETYVFISKSTNLPFILYFWNTRSTYSNAKLAWLPLEQLESFCNLVTEKTTIVVSNIEDKNNLARIYPNNKFIESSIYYFHGAKERWIHFEHDQYISINSDNPMITHPNEKTFSDIGIGGGYAFEVRGPSAFHYPKKHYLGNLFQEERLLTPSFPEYFTRLSDKGISKYFSHFNPLETSGITESFRLPSFKELVTAQFKHVGYRIKETSKTFILEQLLNLINGVSRSSLICEEKIFELIISLTPNNRTEKIIQKNLSKLESINFKDDIISYLGTLRENGDISISSTVVDINSIISKLNLPKGTIKEYTSKLQSLYDNKILLRGKSFKCEHCAASIWIALENLERENYCVECGNTVSIPIFSEGKPTSDYYKLNQLVTRAVDQGQLSTLLLLNYISKQGYGTFKHIANIEIYSDERLISDIDICISIGLKLGICECKSSSPFNQKQIDELIELATKMKSDFIILSCLLDKHSKEINESLEYLISKKSKIPIFILTKNELFNKNPKRIYSYFEVDVRTGEFPSGPIIL